MLVLGELEAEKPLYNPAGASDGRTTAPLRPEEQARLEMLANQPRALD